MTISRANTQLFCAAPSHSTRINGLAVAGDVVGEIHACHIVARTAPDEVRFAVFGLYEILSGAAEDQIAALAAVEFVVATQAPDTIFFAGAVQPFTPVVAAQGARATAAYGLCQRVPCRQGQKRHSDHHEQKSRQPRPLLQTTRPCSVNRRRRWDGATLLQVHGVPCRGPVLDEILGAAG